MIEKFGSAIYFVIVLHVFMLCIAGVCGWIGFRVRFLGDLSLVRDAHLRPLPRGGTIARRYGNSYLAAAVSLVILALGTPLGLPFAAWILLSCAVVIVQLIYRVGLESEGT